MELIGNTYVQASSSDPGAVGYGYDWAQTDTGDVYARNTANTAWVISGNSNQTYLGNLSRQGGVTTGPITGSHGLMPTSGGNFTNAPTINNQAIATVDYVDTRDNYVLSQIDSQVAAAMAALPGVSISQNMVIYSGEVVRASATVVDIVIPITTTYPDGSTINRSDCVSFASISLANFPLCPSTFSFNVERIDAMTWRAYTVDSLSIQYQANVNYIVIAIKPGA